jgi:hypothetical protein
MRSTATKRLLAALLLALSVTLIAIVALTSSRQPQTVRTESDHLTRLDRYAFQSGTVRYDVPNRPLLGPILRKLPAGLKTRLTRGNPEVTLLATATFPSEPLLSAVFTSYDISGKRERAPGTRLAVADDHGQAFDPIINMLGNNGVFQMDVFPRRGKTLRLRLMGDNQLLAEFTIPNPCPGPHPMWQAAMLPAAVTNGAFGITIEKFAVDITTLKTSFVFLVRENGEPSSAWVPKTFEISDATGNHWRPAAERPLKTTDGRVIGWFLGALWPEESAWKVHVTFRNENKEIQASPVVEFLVKPEFTATAESKNH